ncbi:MAG: hypothetical protein RI924_663 [Bacteroidota bacterium]
MKKFVLFALLIALLPLFTLAQAKKSPSASQTTVKQTMDMSMSAPTAKGKWLVGPSLGFSSDTEDDGNSKVKVSSFRLEPEIGYFLMDNMSLGLSFSFGSDQTRVDGTAMDKSSLLYLAPTFRYYLPISPKFQFLGKLQVPVGSRKFTIIGGNDVDIKFTSFGVQAIPAFAFFPSNKIAVELSWGSLYFNSQKQGNETNNQFGMNLLSDDEQSFSNGALRLGVKWHLGK